MRGSCLLLATSWVMVALPLVVGWFPLVAHAQQNGSDSPFSTSSSAWDGYSEFARLAQRQLGTRRVVLTKRLDFEMLSPHDAVIIARPTTALDDTSLSAFLAEGGRLAILDDFGRGQSLLSRFGITRVPAPADPSNMLRNNPNLSIAVPTTQVVAGAERGRHPIAAQIDQVVTNHAVTFSHPDLTPVLEIPSQSRDAHDLAVTGVIAGKGRLFALGDPSVFINLMMRYPGNRHLAEGLVNYLAGDLSSSTEDAPSGAPSSVEKKLYVLTNDFDQVGRFGEEDSFSRKVLQRLEEAKAALAAMKDEGMPQELSAALAALLCIWIFFSHLRAQLRLPRLSTLSFAEPPLLAAQTGLHARAHVLGAQKTNPVLSLIELDAALRETVARRLELNPSMPGEELVAQAQVRGLSSGDAHRLSKLLTALRRFGQSLSEGKPLRATEKELKELHEESMRLIAELERMKGNA